MAKYQREATQYPGVFWLTIQGIETLYIRYKRPGTDKAVEENSDQRRKGGRLLEVMQSGQNASMDKQSQMQSKESLELLKSWQRNPGRPLIDYGKLIWSLRALRLKA